MKLRAISHSRTGDKGAILNVSLIAVDERHYPILVRHVTVDRVRAHFADLFDGDVVRYEMPTIGALNFVLHGSVTRTLALDVHGKSLSSALLEMEIPDEDGNAQP